MGWSDSDDDDDDLDAIAANMEKEAEKKRRKALRKAQGLASESEEEAPVQQSGPQVHQVREKAEIYVPLADPIAEKERQRKLQVDSDLKGAEDLFGSEFAVTEGKAAVKAVDENAAPEAVVEKKVVPKGPRDLWDDVILDTSVEVVGTATKTCEKLLDTQVANAQYRFLVELLKRTEASLSLEDARKLEAKLATMLKDKQVSQTAAGQGKRKGNEKLNKTTKFNVSDELDVVYGDWEDGDWEDGDWEEGGGTWEEG